MKKFSFLQRSAFSKKNKQADKLVTDEPQVPLTEEEEQQDLRVGEQGVLCSPPVETDALDTVFNTVEDLICNEERDHNMSMEIDTLDRVFNTVEGCSYNQDNTPVQETKTFSALKKIGRSKNTNRPSLPAEMGSLLDSKKKMPFFFLKIAGFSKKEKGGAEKPTTEEKETPALESMGQIVQKTLEMEEEKNADEEDYNERSELLQTSDIVDKVFYKVFSNVDSCVHGPRDIQLRKWEADALDTSLFSC